MERIAFSSDAEKDPLSQKGPMDRGDHPVPSTLQDLLASVKEEELRRWVKDLSGPRHGQSNPEKLEEKGNLFFLALVTRALIVSAAAF